MRFYSYILIFFFSSFYFSQNIIKARNELYKGKNLLINAEILRDYYIDESPDSIYTLGKYLCTKSIEKENVELLNFGKILVASQFSKKGKLLEAKNLLYECEKFYFQNRDYYRLSDVYNQLGHCFFIENKIIKAIEFYKKSLQAQDNIDLADEMFMAHLGISECYIKLKQYDKARKEIKIFNIKAKKLNLLKAQRKAQTILGKIDFYEKKYYEGMNHYKIAFKLALEAGDKLSLSNVHNVLAIAYFEQGKIDSALVHFNKALNYRLEMNYPLTIIESYENLAEYYVETNNITKAEVNFLEALKIANEYNFTLEKMNIYERLLEISKLKSTNNKKLLVFQDSILKLYKTHIESKLNEEKTLDSLSCSLKYENLKNMYIIREKTLLNKIKLLEQNDFIKLLVLIFITIISIILIFVIKRKL